MSSIFAVDWHISVIDVRIDGSIVRLEIRVNYSIILQLDTEYHLMYMSNVPPTGRMWHKAFFRWIWAQGHSPDTAGGIKMPERVLSVAQIEVFDIKLSANK